MPTFGLSVTPSSADLVIVSHDVVRWHERRAWDDPDPDRATLLAAIESLVRAAPSDARCRRVAIAVGLPWCQLKSLDGLPAVADRRTLSAVVREQSRSFFLCAGAALVSEAVTSPDGLVWAAAFDATVVGEISNRLRGLGIAPRAFLPAVACIARGAGPGHHQWVENCRTIDLLAGPHGVVTTLHVAFRGTAAPADPLMAALPLAVETRQLQAAVGAALSARRPRFAWMPAPDERTERRRRQAVSSLATAAALVALGIALLAPALRSRRFIATHQGSDLVATTRDSAALASATLALQRVDQGLIRLQRARRQQGETTRLVGTLARALPDSTTVLTLRVDSLGGTLLVRTNDLGGLLDALGDVDGLSSLQVAGPVAIEPVGATRFQRATLRFRHPRPAR